MSINTPVTKPQKFPLNIKLDKDLAGNGVTTLTESNVNIGKHTSKSGDETFIVAGENNEGVIDLGPGNNTVALGGEQDNLRLIGNLAGESIDTVRFPKERDAYEVVPRGNFDVSPPAIDQVTIKEKGSKKAGTIVQDYERFSFKGDVYDLKGLLTNGKPIEKAPIRGDFPDRGTVIR